MSDLSTILADLDALFARVSALADEADVAVRVSAATRDELRRAQSVERAIERAAKEVRRLMTEASDHVNA